MVPGLAKLSYDEKKNNFIEHKKQLITIQVTGYRNNRKINK